MKLVKIFEGVPDFRNVKLVSYILAEVLVIALCGVLSGADDFEEIAGYGGEKESFLSRSMELPRGIPSLGIFRRIFRNMDTKAFGDCPRSQSEEILSGLEGYQINIDGKVLKATGKRGRQRPYVL